MQFCSFPYCFFCLHTQLKLDRYNPSLYWLCIILCSICGTIITDGFHDNLGLMLWIEIIIFSAGVIYCFYFWHTSEKTLDIHSIYTLRRELYYWAAVVWTFALGTAVGDCTATHWIGITYPQILAFFVGICSFIFVVWIGGRYTGLIIKDSDTEIFLFWVAYIFTRPLGASTGDLLGLSVAQGGWGLGTGWTSLLFLGIIVLVVCYLTFTKVDQLPHISTQKISNSTTNDVSNAVHVDAEVKFIELPIATA